ncbi:MAG: hypothetical protein ACRCS6_02825 [Turicibacter sp.]
MVILEIMNSFIINLEFQFMVPMNQTFDSLTFKIILPEGLTYAVQPGAKVKEVNMLGWISAPFIDYSTQATPSPNFEASCICLSFNSALFNPLTDSTFTLSVPVLVYDAPLLLTGNAQMYLLATLTPTRKDGFHQDCSKEFYAYQFKEAALHLYSEKTVVKNSPSDINVLNIVFPLLYNATIASYQTVEVLPLNLTYELNITLSDKNISIDPIQLFTSNPYMPLIKDLDYSEYYFAETSELILMIHTHESLCGKTIYGQIPFSLRNTYPASQLPINLLFDMSLSLVNGVRSNTILNKTGVLLCNIQSDPPVVTDVSLTISTR